MNYLVKLGTLAKPSGKLFPDGLVSERLIKNCPVKPGDLAKPWGKLFPDVWLGGG